MITGRRGGGGEERQGRRREEEEEKETGNGRFSFNAIKCDPRIIKLR